MLKKLKRNYKELIVKTLSPYIALKKAVAFYSLPSRLSNPNVMDVLKHRALVSSAVFIENNGSKAMIFETRTEFWNFGINQADQNLLFAEFGVSQGKSISYLASCVSKNKIIYGFDSFIGLKEDFTGTSFTKGSFSAHGKLPKVPENVRLIEGWFEDSLPSFLKEVEGNFGFLHLDADTYESTKFVLDLLSERIVKNTIILFDEYLGIPNWQNHEHRAWSEFAKNKGLSFRYAAFAPQGAMIRVE